MRMLNDHAFFSVSGPVNMLFYPPETGSFHFRSNLATVFKDSYWALLNYEENKVWGRVWINPSFHLTDLTKFFKEKGFQLSLLSKDALLD